MLYYALLHLRRHIFILFLIVKLITLNNSCLNILCEYALFGVHVIYTCVMLLSWNTVTLFADRKL